MMSITVLIIMSIILIPGIIYTIYSIKTAEIDEDYQEENFDEKAFSKPEGWKVGKLPDELKKTNTEAKHKIPYKKGLVGNGMKLNQSLSEQVLTESPKIQKSN